MGRHWRGDPALSHAAEPLAYAGPFRQRPWNLLLPVIFAIGCWPYPVIAAQDIRIYGAHASIYTDAARVWLGGGDPWLVGPPAAMFAGPPPMLLPFVPFIGLPLDLTRIMWIVGGLLLAMWTLRRLGLPPYFLIFPPLFQVILVGHPEILVLGLLVLGGPASGLAVLIKPYAVVALIAERRWTAIAVGAIGVAVTAPFLPWPLFFEELPRISRLLVTQNTGDSVFGQPVLMIVAAVALASIGLRRALWLAVPVLLPYAQPTYKCMSIPALSPVVAFFWAIPIPGSTLVGVVAEAVLCWIAGRRTIPSWLESGLGPAITWRRTPPKGVLT